jgi:hypothetical protein
LSTVPPTLAVASHLQLVRDAINVAKMLLPGFDYLQHVRSISRVVAGLHGRVLESPDFAACLFGPFWGMSAGWNV